MKYQKNVTIQVWRNAPSYQDEEGAWHEGKPTILCSFWAYASGRDYAETYALHAAWVRPVIQFTITRPRDENLPQVGDHVLYRNTWFEIKTVNALTDTVGHDYKLVCEEDKDFATV